MSVIRLRHQLFFEGLVDSRALLLRAKVVYMGLYIIVYMDIGVIASLALVRCCVTFSWFSCFTSVMISTLSCGSTLDSGVLVLCF